METWFWKSFSSSWLPTNVKLGFQVLLQIQIKHRNWLNEEEKLHSLHSSGDKEENNGDKTIANFSLPTVLFYCEQTEYDCIIFIFLNLCLNCMIIGKQTSAGQMHNKETSPLVFFWGQIEYGRNLSMCLHYF